MEFNGEWTAILPNRKITIPFPVPGDLISALVSAGKLPDPFYGRNERAALWVGRENWILRREFNWPIEEIPENGGPVYLEIEQLDTVAEVFINKQSIGTARNMFHVHKFIVPTGFLHKKNTLEIHFIGPETAAFKVAESLPYPVPHSMPFSWGSRHRNLIRKVQCHAGWDWGPVLMTSGIYGFIRMTGGNRGQFGPLSTRQRHNPDASVRLDVEIDYESFTEEPVEIFLTFNDVVRFNRTFPGSGMYRITESFTLENPQLWWPAGYGAQPLYNLEIKTPEETRHWRIGIRRIELDNSADDNGRRMTLLVNGRPVFAKGSNWIPTDALPARTGIAVRRLLEDARAASMNCIRVWGGGNYESDEFYNICDELGILVWQDFMFSCSLYPATRDFLDNVKPEVEYQVNRLKNHACLAVWCGNNEDVGALTWYSESIQNRDRYIVDYDRLNEGVIGNAVRALHPDGIWWSSSPSAGPGDYSDCWHDDSQGDMHYWSVWHEGLPFESYYDVTPRFCSEFGFQSFPSLHTVKTYASEMEFNISSPVMRYHQRNDRGNAIIMGTMASYFRMPQDFASTLFVSQVQQAYAMRTAVEYWRSRRPVCMGALIWQLNDVWPCASWSGIEYGGRWKVLHYECARFFKPFWIPFYIKDGKIRLFAVNDSFIERQGTFTVKQLGYNGEISFQKTFDNVIVPAESSIEIWQENVPESFVREKYFMVAEWSDMPVDDKPEADSDDSVPESPGTDTLRNYVFLNRPADCKLWDARVTVKRGKKPDSILIETDLPAFYVTPDTPLPGRFSDAGFLLLPEEEIEVRFIPYGDEVLPDSFFKSVKVFHLMNDYRHGHP